MTDDGTRIFSGDHLRATIFRPMQPRLAVTFTFREKGRSDFPAVHAINHIKDRGFAQLSITSRRNDWFINPDTAGLENALRTLSPAYKSIHMLGFSMGGYGAIRFAQAVGAQYATLISPQFSIHPDVVPTDRRFISDAAGFDRDAGDLTQVRVADLQGVIAVDPFRPLDLMNAQMIQHVFPKLKLARLAFGGHPATGVLRRANRAGIIQRVALDVPPRPAPVIALHRAARANDSGYHKERAEYVLNRAI